LALGIVIVSYSAADEHNNSSCKIIDANPEAQRILSLDTNTGIQWDLSHFLPMTDTEIRFGRLDDGSEHRIDEVIRTQNYKIVLRLFSTDTYVLQLLPEQDNSNEGNTTRAMVQALKQEMLKAIAKEAYLIRENNYFKRLLNELPVMVALKDTNLNYRYANKSFCDFVCITQRHLIGKDDYQICTPDQADYFRAIDNEILHTRKPRTIEESYRDKHGITRDIITKKSAVHDSNGNLCLQLVCIDVSEPKRLQRELEEAKRQYENVAELSSYVVWVLGFDFKHRFISPSIKHFQGYDPDEFLKLDLTQSLTESAMQEALRIRDQILKWHQEQDFDTLKQTHETVMDYYHKDGSIVKGKVLYKVICDDDYKLLGIHGSTIKIDY